MNLLRTDNGFSLVELLIALTILAIGLLGILGMQVYAIRGNAFSSNMSIAQNIAQQKLEYYRNLSYNNVRGVPEFGTEYVGQAAVVPATDLPADDYLPPFPENAADTVRVDVEAYGALRADNSGTVFEDIAPADGTPDPPFDRFRRVTIVKAIDGAVGGLADTGLVIKVIVYWRNPSGTEDRVEMMAMKSIGE